MTSSRQKASIICLLLLCFPLILSVVFSLKPQIRHKTSFIFPSLFLHQQENAKPPTWFDFIAKHINTTQNNNIKIGLVNIDTENDATLFDHLPPQVEKVHVNFDHVNESLKWDNIFPQWINEDPKRAPSTCPRIPMPAPEKFRDLNVVVARVPCGKKIIDHDDGNTTTNNNSSRDVFRLQVNLVVANLAVQSGWVSYESNRTVIIVFVGYCGPMVEIFKCDDVLMQHGEYSVYKPNINRLKQLTFMPVGSCQIAPAYAQTGKEIWRNYMKDEDNNSSSISESRMAYVTILHSSESYVCGAIALAQSILKTHKHNLKPNTDLLILVDNSIGAKSIKGLKSAGWKIKRIQRILNPFAQKNSYNQWNYSKLRIWQLIQYDKVIFIDSDLLLLKHIHDFSVYPQLSASPNHGSIFNSGLMIIEPSLCMFEHLMRKTFEIKPYNGGDQGFLNEVFTWWHRLPKSMNFLKYNTHVPEKDRVGLDIVNNDVHAVHYLGYKPWMCYKDYDCNWDSKSHHVFASDLAHRIWWEIYEEMPKDLQAYCGVTKKMDQKLMKLRDKARNASLADGHWKIQIKDSRREHYVVE